MRQSHAHHARMFNRHPMIDYSAGLPVIQFGTYAERTTALARVASHALVFQIEGMTSAGTDLFMNEFAKGAPPERLLLVTLQLSATTVPAPLDHNPHYRFAEKMDEGADEWLNRTLAHGGRSEVENYAPREIYLPTGTRLLCVPGWSDEHPGIFAPKLDPITTTWLSGILCLLPSLLQ